MPTDLGQTLMSFLPMVLIFGVLIAMMIIPQRKRDKQVKEMLASMKKGDYVRTIGGIIGRIVQLKEDEVVIETGPDKVKMVFARGAIATVTGSEVQADSLSNTESLEKK